MTVAAAVLSETDKQRPGAALASRQEISPDMAESGGEEGMKEQMKQALACQMRCFEHGTGWWFGTCFIFPYIGNNNPSQLIFFRGGETTNQGRKSRKSRKSRPGMSWVFVVETIWESRVFLPLPFGKLT